MPSCSLIFNFRIEKGNPNNLKIPCMIRRKFIANAYIDLDLPMNVMFITYYNAIMIQGYEHRGLNYVGIGMDMHVFVGNMSYVMDINILEKVKANIDPRLSQVVFSKPLVETTRVILSDDDVRRGCESPWDLESGFYKDIVKLGPLYRKDGTKIEMLDLEISSIRS
ncbi:hypothetical protein Tco_1187170, partial [Tanacetum coccineum]